MRCSTNLASSSRRRRRRADAARGAHHRRVRGNPAVRRAARPRAAARRRPATFSSGSMPCASTACARLQECRALLAPLDHQGLLGRRSAAAQPSLGRRSTTTSCWPSWAWMPPAGGHHRASPCPHERRQARSRGNRQPHRMRGLRDSSSRCSSRCSTSLKSGVRQTRPFRSSRRPRSRQDEFFIVGGQIAYVAEVGEDVQAPNTADATRGLRVIYDNGTESNLLAALAPARALQGRRRPADHRARSPGRCSPVRSRTAIWRAARSMFCAASPTIRSSRPTATFCTRSA